MAAKFADHPAALLDRMTRQKYPNPPIVEAIIDIQAEFAAPISLSAVEQFGSKEQGRYPIREGVFSLSLVVDGETGTANSQQALVGYRYRTATPDAIIQVRTNGVLVSKLPPYDCWESNLAEAKRLWTRYANEMKPTHVTRVAVRYINRLELPGTAVDLADYLISRPELPSVAGLAVSSFVMRIDAPIPGLDGATLILHTGTAQSSDPDRTPVLLDLDVVQEKRFSATSQDMWDALNALHDSENRLFESCLTNATRELFT